MKPVINDLKKIHNLKQAYIHSEGKEKISTFNAAETTKMHSSIELIEQYFMAAQGIEKSYNEMIFPLENGNNLIAFLVDEATLVITLTEEKINLPMLHMALTVIIKKLNNGTYQKQATRASTLLPSIKKPIQQQEPQESVIPIPKKPRPQVTQTPVILTKQTTITTEKNPALSLRSLFSNPFSAKKNTSNANNERPYTLLNGQKIYQNEAKQKRRPLPTDKKLVYREQKT
jgi:hypothetical protein